MSQPEEKIIIELELSPKQLAVINSSLDLSCRLLLGQFDELERLFWRLEGYLEKDRERARELLTELQKIYFPDLDWNSSYGINNEEVPEHSKVAYEICRAIRHAMWKAEGDNQRHNVASAPPHEVSSESIPIVSIKQYVNPKK